MNLKMTMQWFNLFLLTIYIFELDNGFIHYLLTVVFWFDQNTKSKTVSE